jgi:hypothetical protein
MRLLFGERLDGVDIGGIDDLAANIERVLHGSSGLD